MKRSRLLFLERKLAFALLAVFLALFAFAGCQSVKLPVVMSDNPSLADVLGAVNANSAKIQSLRGEDGTLGVSNVAGWANCRVAYQRPQNIRLVGTANMMGRVIDFGSNDRLFWYWSKFDEPSQILYASHSEYAASPMKERIPVDPAWFPEALGVIDINAADVIEGPIIQPDKTLLIVTRRQRPDGVYKKYTFIEPKTAAVKRQDIMDPTGQTVVTVVCSKFQVDQATGVVLPKNLVLSSPKASETIHLDLGTLRVNPSEGFNTALFELPPSEEIGAPSIDVGKATAAQQVIPQQTSAPPMVAPPAASVPAAAPPAAAPSATTSVAPPAPSYSSGNELSGVVHPSVDIPPANATPVTVGQVNSGSATAHFQTVIAPSENRFMDQSFFAPPLN